ncbi:phosphotriesterase [Mycolicibacterium helvum]|uniref:Phosphotriesterase n=2 Tax=Mycolicibacterium helvum TaxID=1534349 RepID=A0A7I7TE56_9MYCO|nr:phosphotriesterase [Mycolicibacterium helvum]
MVLTGPWHSGGLVGRAEFERQQVDAAVTALSGLRTFGFGTVVDLSPYGDAGRDAYGHNVRLLKEIAEGSGVSVVVGTATYRQEFSPQWVLDASIDELTNRFISDAHAGIADTGIRAGIIGEQPTSENLVTDHDEKGLRAAARAAAATGLALATHTTHGTMALEQIDIIASEGTEPSRVVIGHMDNHTELDYLRRVLDRGVSIGFDSIGKQFWDARTPYRIPPGNGEANKRSLFRSDETRADWLATLIREGYRDQIVLSHDLVGAQVALNPETHGQHGYTYIGAVFTELLRRRGVTPADLEALLHSNPARLLQTDIRP